MKNTTLGILMLVIILIIGAYAYFGSAKSNGNAIAGNVVAEEPQVLKGEIQRVILSQKDLNYYPTEVKVNAGQPVSISLDDKVKGCLRSLTVRELGLAKYLKTTSDTLDFTPTKKGTFTIVCSMGMGYGKFIVE